MPAFDDVRGVPTRVGDMEMGSGRVPQNNNAGVSIQRGETLLDCDLSYFLWRAGA